VKRLFLLNTISGYGFAPCEPMSPWFEVVKKHYAHPGLHPARPDHTPAEEYRCVTAHALSVSYWMM
jgi:hypothetical protein